jgi:hypothetical protein
VKRPAFQFYPADWRKDVELRSCSLMARGLWIDMLCIAHECDPYGHLTVNGKAMTAANIAGQVGIPTSLCSRLVQELISNGVARRNGEGVIYSKRMVDDEAAREARAEIGRQNGVKGAAFGSLGAEHGKKGGRPNTENPGENPGEKPGQKPPQNPRPSSSSSSSASALIPPTPSGVGSGSPLRVVPPSAPPAFDGSNAEALNGKAVVQLAAGWELPESWGLDAEALGWKPAQVLREAERFRQYWVAGDGKGKRRSVRGWRQSWSNWLGKAERMAR